MVPDDFYHAFEDKFRGARQDIKRRQAVYLPLVDAVADRVNKPGLDIGCGRAEWLELLTERGVRVAGVDMNADFVKLGKSLNLDIVEGEANAYLDSQADASLSFVSAFHVVEHLSFDVLLRFLANARRVLDDDGFLLLETPNPSNLSVGANTFYMDPTHERPLPPGLLSFAVEYVGFCEAIVVPVNRDLIDNPLLSLVDGVPGSLSVNRLVRHLSDTLMSAPDYAVVGIKTRSNQLGAKARKLVSETRLPTTTDVPFDVPELLERVELGLKNADIAHSTAETAVWAGEKASRSIEHLDGSVAALDSDLSGLKIEVAALQVQTSATVARYEVAEIARKELQVRFADSSILAEQRESELQRMLASTSWRVTAPLRAIARLRLERKNWKSILLKVIRPLATRVAGSLEARPNLKSRLSLALWRFPKLRTRLAHLVGRARSPGSPQEAMLTVEKVQRLSTRAHIIYVELRTARIDRLEDSATTKSYRSKA